ncbi:hypothetical protein [Streptomyces alfalfae]|uniref:Uncharacterized protein n=1 Tax=Streptomyces alfalfae TaxID=1642299 RepID=A0A7T4PBH3_9ACTN|nr:hypothetical protein [Streptomyces alfalfae]QQC87191.1 hypothetical protein I8755_01205 [Streptomyces alfalfae]
MWWWTGSTAGDSPQKALKAGALGRRVTVTGVTGVGFVFRPQPTICLLWHWGKRRRGG